jgi:urocanate hydratase
MTQIDYFLLVSLLENQRVDEEEAILDEAMENLTDATRRLRAIRNRLWVTGLEERVNYRDLAHRVSSALAMTEAAYLEARRRRSKQER